MKMIDAVKGVGAFVVSIGAGAIVGNAVKFTTPQTIGVINKLFVAVGSVALSWMVGDKAAKWTEEKIDETAEQLNGFVTIEPVKKEESEKEDEEAE